jgi:hypothetical protein
VSRTAGRSGKRAGQARAAGSGGREAIVRTHLSPWARQRSQNILDRGIGKEPGRRIGLPKKLVESGMRRRGALGDECQLQVVDDPVDDGMVLARTRLWTLKPE